MNGLLRSLRIAFVNLFGWFALSLSASLGQGTSFSPNGRSISADEQFTIIGSRPEVRGRVMAIAVELKKELYDLLLLKQDQWKNKISIQLYGEVGAVPPPRLMNTSFQILPTEVLMKLDIHLANGLEEERLKGKLTELMLYEIGLRNEVDDEGEITLKIFPWLIEGILEALNWKKNRTDRELYASLFKREGIISFNELLRPEGLDQQLGYLDLSFRVSSGALVMALINQPEGVSGLRDLLLEAPSYEGEQKSLIAKHFPAVNLSTNSLAKWWSLQLASMTVRPAEQLYTIADTEAELDEILQIKFIDKEKKTVHIVKPDFYDKMKEVPIPALSVKLGRVMGRLSRLSTRAFPSYRPIIRAYQEEFKRIANRKKDDEWSLGAIPQLEQERLILNQLGERMTDYLNWYQLEAGEKTAVEFDDYLKLREQLENASDSDGGPIARYLDSIETLYAPEKRDGSQ